MFLESGIFALSILVSGVGSILNTLQSQFYHLTQCCHKLSAICLVLWIVGSSHLKMLAAECARTQDV
jgi:hypothetical protein